MELFWNYSLNLPFSRKPKDMVNFKYVLSSTDFSGTLAKAYVLFLNASTCQHKFVYLVSQTMLGLVSRLTRINCTQVKWCHPCQESKLGYSRKESETKTLWQRIFPVWARKVLFHNELRRTFKWQSKQSWRQYSTYLWKMSSF